MTTILLVRHGQSTANLARRFAGHFDAELTPLGLSQAACTAQFIKNHYTVDKICSSTLTRARQTADAAAALLGLPVCPEPDLREIFAGEWEGQFYDALVCGYPEEYRCWRENIGLARCNGGESVMELADRVWKAVCRIASENEGKTVLIASHATPIRAVLWKISGLAPEQMKSVPWASNASVSEICFRDGVFAPVKISQDAHLAELKTVFPSNV